MKIVYSDAHRAHSGAFEVSFGALVPMYEAPDRIDVIRAQLLESGLTDFMPAEPFAEAPMLAVHEPDYVRFLSQFWSLWKAEGGHDYALPYSFRARGMRDRVPLSVHGRLGHYCFDMALPFVEGSWNAIRASADTALTGQHLVATGERAVFALCRPPGHHAMPDMGGGYCFLNNAAMAAQAFIDQGAKRVAVLDIDYHHGNGTQTIFYPRGDVLFVSLHGDPDWEYPYFLGYADETGAGAGEGCNANFPLPMETAWDRYGDALRAAVGRIVAFSPDALVVSLGVDTYKDDPVSRFRLESDDFTRVGAEIGHIAVPTLFVMEGGYAMQELGINVVNVLTGYLNAR
jgi:acetoin utilization deacetylase AcuC-like enzyme